MAKYRKKPIVIEALQFKTNNETGSPNMDSIINWVNQGKSTMGAWHNGTNIFINTLEGETKADVGDFIIKGIQSEYYLCKPDVFEKTYEKVEEAKFNPPTNWCGAQPILKGYSFETGV